MRVFALRLRRTIRDSRRIWRPNERGRLDHLRRCWKASKLLIIVGAGGKVYEIP